MELSPANCIFAENCRQEYDTDFGNGMRKVRMAITSKGKGKSSGARVIAYHVILTHEHIEINLLTIYDKGELTNVSDSYLKSLLTGLL